MLVLDSGHQRLRLMAAILVGHHQSGAGKQSWKGAGVTREEVGGNVSVWERTYQRMTGRRKRRVLLQRTGADKWTDKKCPFTGLVSIRGRILTGTVVSTKMHRTLVIRREYLHFVPKYARYEKRHKNLAAHVSPAFRVEEGDQVTVGQCRPLSKTVSRRKIVHRVQDTDFASGSLQRPPCTPPYWKHQGQAVQQVLDGEGRFVIASMGYGIDSGHSLRGTADDSTP